MRRLSHLFRRRLWTEFPSSAVKVEFPVYFQEYVRRKQKDDFFSKPVVNSIIGGLMTVIGGFASNYLLAWREDERKEKDAEALFEKKCELLKKYISSSERSLVHSRESFVRGLGNDVINSALQISRKQAQEALEMHKEFSNADKERFKRKEGYDYTSLVNLISHIDYHLGSLLLKEYEVSEAKLELARSLAERISVSDNKQHSLNEIHRTKIKIADSLSQFRNLSVALRLYDDLCKPIKASTLLTTFWKARALNNRAVVLYAIGQDELALESMLGASDEISDFFVFLSELDRKDIKSITLNIQQLKEVILEGKNKENIEPSPQFCNFVEKGKVSSVDILHLPFISEIIGDSDLIKKVFKEKKVAMVAFECLERIRLLFRKQFTAVGNCIVMLSCPYSAIEASPISLCFLLDKLFKLPTADILYKELDNDWVRQEGSLRLQSAILSGMITLLDAELRNPHNSMAIDEWKHFLDKGTMSISKKSRSYSNTVASVHKYFASFVRARFLILFKRNEEAIEELEYIREWIIVEQKAAQKKIKRAEKNGVMFPHFGVPPRHARLQISSLLMLSRLQPHETINEKSLLFALESFHMESDNHPLEIAANEVRSNSRRNVLCFGVKRNGQTLPANISPYYKDLFESIPENFPYKQLLVDAKKCIEQWD